MTHVEQNSFSRFKHQCQKTPNDLFQLNASDQATATFFETATQAAKIAAALKTFGIEHGHTLLVQPTSTAQDLHILLACLQLGVLYCVSDDLTLIHCSQNRFTPFAAVMTGESPPSTLLEHNEFYFTGGENGSLTTLATCLPPWHEVAPLSAADMAILDLRQSLEIRHQDISACDRLVAIWHRLLWPSSCQKQTGGNVGMISAAHMPLVQ